jgi:hypothetical protein
MMRLPRWLPQMAAIPAAFVVNVLIPGQASAHVKWFCAFNVAGQPVGLENVLCPDFELLAGMSILTLMAGCLVEWTALGPPILRSLDRVTAIVRDNTELLVRATVAFFFISIWAVGGILLTPELKTNSVAVGAIQLGIAFCLLWRRTMPLSALGIAIIYAIAIWNYGIFHLADYPIFLGIAVYLALTGLQRDFFGIKPLDIMRWGAGITLMWASIEKWAYPEWTYPLLINHPDMTLGFDVQFYMRAAGAIEFAAAFALMWTPLVRRCAAIMLAAMFIGAVFEFGKIDMIGHSGIIAVLFAIAADNRTQSRLVPRPWLAPVSYAGALAAVLAVYYFGHAALFGTSIT